MVTLNNGTAGSALIAAIFTLVILPIGGVIWYIYTGTDIPDVYIVTPKPGVDDGVEIPNLPATIGGKCIVKLVWEFIGAAGAATFTYNLPQDTAHLLGDIVSNIERYKEAFSLFDALSQRVSSDQMLDNFLGGDRMSESEIQQEAALLSLKSLMTLIRYLEAIYKVYNPSYISTLPSDFFEED